MVNHCKINALELDILFELMENYKVQFNNYILNSICFSLVHSGVFSAELIKVMKYKGVFPLDFPFMILTKQGSYSFTLLQFAAASNMADVIQQLLLYNVSETSTVIDGKKSFPMDILEKQYISKWSHETEQCKRLIHAFSVLPQEQFSEILNEHYKRWSITLVTVIQAAIFFISALINIAFVTYAAATRPKVSKSPLDVYKLLQVVVLYVEFFGNLVLLCFGAAVLIVYLTCLKNARVLYFITEFSNWLQVSVFKVCLK